ncbi:MAG: histidine kinase [Rhodospirillales bacterium]|jgi:CheY-like chemotaxis protein|nr:histidine kinase [Rhodospirillales bacterium]
MGETVDRDAAGRRKERQKARVGTHGPPLIVLVVEDDDDVRDLAVEILEMNGYTVLSAGNGPDALAILRRERDIGLLFTDIVMPGGMNGAQLAEAAQRVQPALKILLASGYADRSILDPLVLGQGMSFVQKPYRPDDIAARVRALLLH